MHSQGPSVVCACHVALAAVTYALLASIEAYHMYEIKNLVNKYSCAAFGIHIYSFSTSLAVEPVHFRTDKTMMVPPKITRAPKTHPNTMLVIFAWSLMLTQLPAKLQLT